jgi:hypothetical protein
MESKEQAHIGGILTIKTFKDGQLIRELGPIPNKVVSSSGYGRNLLIRQLAGDTTYPIEIDSMAIGDDDTTAADGNTGLGNSLESGITITDMTVTNNQLEIDVFVADANLPDDDYKELGFFCNGRLFSRIIIAPTYTKADGEDSLFTYTLTFSG